MSQIGCNNVKHPIRRRTLTQRYDAKRLSGRRHAFECAGSSQQATQHLVRNDLRKALRKLRLHLRHNLWCTSDEVLKQWFRVFCVAHLLGCTVEMPTFRR